MKTKLYIVVVIIGFIALFSASNASATVIDYQVDKIQISPDAYTNVGDQYSLNIAGPITSTVTINLASNAGCNLCNAIVQWGTAINNDPVMSSFLTATYDVWDGVSVVPLGGGYNRADFDAGIYLTANTAGVEFFSSASVLSLTGIPKTLPYFTDLSISVSTITPAISSVPEPSAFFLLGIGLILLAIITIRKSNAEMR